MPLPILPVIAAPFFTSLLAGIVTWVLRKSVITFVVATVIYFVIYFLTPIILRLLSPYLGSSPVAMLNSIPQSVWYFASAFEIVAGVKLMFAAYIARFLIRRIPFVG